MTIGNLLQSLPPVEIQIFLIKKISFLCLRIFNTSRKANVLNNSFPTIIMNNGSGGGDIVQEHVLPANILPAEDRPIGDPSFLENSFSLTVTKLKSDTDVNVLFILENFLKLYCTKGILL